MVAVHYGPFVAYDPTTKALVQNAAGQVYAITDTAFASPLSVKDLSGVPMADLRSNADGVLDEFQVEDHTEVNWQSGPYVIRLSSFKAVKDIAEAAAAAAAEAVEIVESAPSILPAGGSLGDILYRTAEHAGEWGPAPDDALAAELLDGGLVRPEKLPAAAVGLSAEPGDQTARLNDWLATPTPLGVKKALGEFAISELLTVPAGTYLDLTRARITQTANNKVTLYLQAGATVMGGEFVGKETDYVANASPAAIGISAAGDNCTINGVVLRGFSGAAIRGYGVNNLRVLNTTIVGVGTPAIAPGDGGPCNGVLVDLPSTGVTISNVDISDVCQGIQTGRGVTHVTISSTRIHGVPGQHGCYIQNGTGLNVTGLDISNCFYNGLKVQKAVTDTEDDLAGSIVGVTVKDCGDTGVLLSQTAPNLSAATMFRGFTLANIAASGCKRGIYLGSVVDSTLSNVSVLNSLNEAVTFVNCRNIEGGDLVWHTSGRCGLLFNVATGSTQDRIHLRGVRGHNAGNNNDGSNLDGVRVDKGANITLDGLTVTADNGYLRYGLFVASAAATDQESFGLRNADLSGSTVSARFQSPVTTVKDWVNNRFAGTVTNKPSGSSAPVLLGGGGTPSSPGAQNALVGASFDPVLAGSNLTVLTAGVLFLVKVQLPDGGALGNVWFATGAAGSALTSGQNFVGVYEAAAGGALLGSSADQSTLSFAASGGLKSVALSSPTPSRGAGSSVYLAFLFNGTTGPSLRGITGSAIAANANLSIPRFATAGSSLTSLPSTLPTLTAVLTPVWAAAS